MRREAFDMRYYNTYYYAKIVNNILGDPFDYLRTIHDLFENDGDLSFLLALSENTRRYIGSSGFASSWSFWMT